MQMYLEQNSGRVQLTTDTEAVEDLGLCEASGAELGSERSTAEVLQAQKHVPAASTGAADDMPHCTWRTLQYDDNCAGMQKLCACHANILCC
jgi:hypothetical protein